MAKVTFVMVVTPLFALFLCKLAEAHLQPLKDSEYIQCTN